MIAKQEPRSLRDEFEFVVVASMLACHPLSVPTSLPARVRIVRGFRDRAGLSVWMEVRMSAVQGTQ
jgi:hypothetical protein